MIFVGAGKTFFGLNSDCEHTIADIKEEAANGANRK